MDVQHQAVQPNFRSLTISGSFPNGLGYSDTFLAGSSYEAMIQALADCRYLEDGGDLEVTHVIDAITGESVDSTLLSASLDLLPEVEALEYVIQSAQEFIDRNVDISQADFARLRAYIEFFDLVLSVSPLVFEGLSSGNLSFSDDEISLEFEDSRDMVFDFVPADALLLLAETSISTGVTISAMQTKAMAIHARHALSKACIDVFA